MRQGHTFPINFDSIKTIPKQAFAVLLIVAAFAGALFVILPIRADAIPDETSASENETVETQDVPTYGANLPNGLEGQDNDFDYCVTLCISQLVEVENVQKIVDLFPDVITEADAQRIENLKNGLLHTNTFASLRTESEKVKGFKEDLADRRIKASLAVCADNRIAREEAAKKEAEEKAAREEAERKAQEEAEAAPAERPVYPENEGGALTASKGVVYFNGHKETYYSQRVLPGGGLSIPGRHVEPSDGTVRDGDNYICVAADPEYMAYGSTLETSLGPAKVYDCGCDYGTIDIYVDW